MNTNSRSHLPAAEVSSPNKHFSIRPHPPLIPLFQLPQDQLSAETNSTLNKRFMYRKPKMFVSSGKYHGADDDLKLLNVIESFCAAKNSQSVKVNRNYTKV